MNEIMLFIGGAALGVIAGWLMAQRRTASGNDQALQLAQLADAKLRESQAGAKADLTALLSPIQTQLAQLNEHTHALEKNREGAYQNLRAVIEALNDGHKSLQKETSTLSKALRSPNARGRWGEKQLRNVLEMSGMTNYCGFTEQGTMDNDGKNQRPDVVVDIPGGGKIAIDSKVPLNAFQDMIAAEDESTRLAAHQRHAADVKKHVVELSKRTYWQGLPSPQFVVLFLPGDHFLHSALEADPNLLDDALAKNVLLATPVTLIALLKSIAYGWRQEKLAQNAVAVSALGRELYGRLSTLASHWQKVGAALLNATKSYNESVGTLETRVLVTARKFADYGAVEDTAELAIAPIDEVSPRALTAPEFDQNSVGEELRKLG